MQYGSRLQDAEKTQPALPFSGLRLPLESKTSQFGRPPQSNFPQLYPPAGQSTSSSSNGNGNQQRLIPTVHDPFFLPPPFIPSHPHLRDLCAEAVTYLQQTHDRYEAEVAEFVAKKAGEMRELEDTVRCEVEMLWNTFVENDEELRASSGAGAGERGSSLSRRGSRVASSSTNARSASREPPIRAFSPSPSARTRAPAPAPSGLAQSQQQHQQRGSSMTATSASMSNPILNEAVNNPAYPAGSSLLSASLASSTLQQQQQQQQRQPSQPQPQAAPGPAGSMVDDSIARVSQTYEKSGDARAVAMSHVFSVLDDAMANNKRERRRSRSRSIGNGTPAQTSTDQQQQQQNDPPNVHGKDSWIDNERLVAKGVGKEPTIQEESAGTSGKQTPQPGASSTTKEVKRTVTFNDQPGGDGPSTRAQTNGDSRADRDNEQQDENAAHHDDGE